MMDKQTHEYIAKALDDKIKRLTEFIEWQQRTVDSSKKELETKLGSTFGSGDFAISFEYDESTAKKLLNVASDRIAKKQPHLDRYLKAREDVRKEFGV